jgi:uncharacterized protein YuzE
MAALAVPVLAVPLPLAPLPAGRRAPEFLCLRMRFHDAERAVMTMLKYDADVDALYASIRSFPVCRTIEIDDGTNVDVDTAGHVVGIEVLNPGRIWPLAAILRRYPDITDEDAGPLIGACPFAGGTP